MTDKEAKIIIKKYLKDVSTKVVCSYTIKKFFISDLKNKLNDYFEDNQHITMDLIHSNFGTPEEIANGFDELKTDKLQNQAKNFKIFLIITISYIKKGTKNVTMYRSNGTMLWNYYLTGDFEIIPGVSATALNSSYEVTNKSSGWKFSNGSSYTNGNRVEGRGTFKHVVLFITIKNVTIEINLAADSSGNIK